MSVQRWTVSRCQCAVMKDFTYTLILLLIILLKSGFSHVTMHQYHEQTGYPVSYSRLLGPTSTPSMTMNHGRMTLHPVPTHTRTTTTTLWPAQSNNKNSQHPSIPSTSWTRHQDIITTPSPWKIIIPTNSYEHYHNPNQKITVIHHHVIHRIQQRTQKPTLQTVVTSTVRPRTSTTMRVVSTSTTTEAPVTRVLTTSTTQRAEVTERSTTKEVNNCSGEKQKQEIWESEESLERNFPLYSDY